MNGATVASAFVAAGYTFATSHNLAVSLQTGFVVLGGVWLLFFVWFTGRNLAGWNRLWKPWYVQYSATEAFLQIRGRAETPFPGIPRLGTKCVVTCPDGRVLSAEHRIPQDEPSEMYRFPNEFGLVADGIVPGQYRIRWHELTKRGRWRPFLEYRAALNGEGSRS